MTSDRRASINEHLCINGCIIPRVQGVKCVTDATLFTTRSANLLLVYSLLQWRTFQMSYDTTRSVSDIIKCPIRVSVARSALLCVSERSRAQRCHIKPSIDLTGGIRGELKRPLRS